jgi:7-carboxy-7-deazaguanine synthase
MLTKMNVYSIYSTLNGEVGLVQGAPTTFLRLAGCPLRCVWCDTPYALTTKDGTNMLFEEIVEKIKVLKNPHLCITGGDPMVQQNKLHHFLELDEIKNMEVSIETGGSLLVDKPLRLKYFVFDYKLPGSQMNHRMKTVQEYINMIRSFHAEAYVSGRIWWWKMVVQDKNDFYAAWSFVRDMYLEAQQHELLHLFGSAIKFAVSPVWGEAFASDLAMWLEEAKDSWEIDGTSLAQFVHVNLQLHKVIWPAGEIER